MLTKTGVSRARFVVSLIGGVALFIVLILLVGVDKLTVRLQQASLVWIVFSAATAFLVVPARAWRWQLLLKPVSRKVKLASTFWVTAIGTLVNFLVPVRIGGELGRAFLIGRKEEVGFFGGLSSIAVERLLDLLGIVTLGFAGLSLIESDLSPLIFLINALRAVGIITLVVLIIIFIGARREEATLLAFSKVLSFLPLKIQHREKTLQLAKSVLDGARGISYGKASFALIILGTWVVWGLNFLSTYALFRAFGYDIAWPIALLGSMLVSLSFILPAAPGYVGTYQAYWSLIFGGLGLTNFNAVLAVGIVSHLMIIGMTLALGSFGMVWLGMTFSEVIAIRKFAPPGTR